eukprot:SAG11_NODE_294_length_11142_cov_7.050439_8_plen_66_part_00
MVTKLWARRHDDKLKRYIRAGLPSSEASYVAEDANDSYRRCAHCCMGLRFRLYYITYAISAPFVY